MTTVAPPADAAATPNATTRVVDGPVVDLPVLGMTCAACVRRVETAARSVDGVARVDVNLPLSRARIVFAPTVAATSARAAAAAIRDAGYDVPADVVDALDAPDPADDPRAATAGAARLAALDRAARAEVSGLRRDAIVALALAAPTIALAMLGDAPWMIYAEAALATLVVTLPGRRYLRSGVTAIRHRAPDMTTLIALGAGTAWLASWIALLRGDREHLYFEAAAAIIGFAMLGKLLESRARARLADAVRGLTALAPARAQLTSGLEVDAAALAPGDVVIVRPGERVAADGTVVEGSSSVDESLLTGESLPVAKSEGSPIYAGTLNHAGAVTVRVARGGADTALARIARAVEDAQGNKAPISRLADRVSAWFVPAVLAIAIATGLGWLVAGGAAAVAVERAVAVLVIACPCALGLATPAAVAVGTSRAAELGVLFKGGAAVETASRVDTCLVDKTGTLTAGEPALVAVRALAPGHEDEVLAAAAAIERHAEHPIAHAIVAGAAARKLAVEPVVRDVVVSPSGGIAGTVAGRAVRVGTLEYLALAGIDTTDATLIRHVADAVATGEALAVVALDGSAAGVVVVADAVTDAAPPAIADLHAAGIDVAIISGDREPRARAAGAAVGVPADRVFADVRPTGKAAIVSRERAAGHVVAMVGDGVNDAPALAAADLGVALASGTDLAASVADVTLLRGIAGLPVALALARATLRTIRTNLAAASIYNVVCVPIAAAGLLEPMYAAAAMSLSSVSVVLSSLRLRRWQPRGHARTE
jgi:Cu+-exporting ATPase